MRQGSYVVLLITMTVVMAAALTAVAITFDKYVIKSDDAFSKLNMRDSMSDIAEGNLLDNLITQFERLV